MRIVDRILMWFDNKYEEYTHYVFNKKPHYVRCGICGEVLSSKNGDTPSPEECGWREFKTGGWVCHRCDAHRDFTPYIKLTDLDEAMIWNVDNPQYSILEALKKRDLLFRDTTVDLCDHIDGKRTN